MHVHCSQDTCEHQKELGILMRCLAGIQHVDAVVRRDRPVIMLTGTIHACERFFMEQALQAVLTCHSL